MIWGHMRKETLGFGHHIATFSTGTGKQRLPLWIRQGLRKQMVATLILSMAQTWYNNTKFSNAIANGGKNQNSVFNLVVNYPILSYIDDIA